MSTFSASSPAILLRSIRLWLAVVILGLLLSGITAFPLAHELHWLSLLAVRFGLPAHAPSLAAWIFRVDHALADTDARYPFLAYGTDWLAFAHLALAVLFLGPWRDPVRNRWCITFGLIACAGVPLLALIAGPIRGIPFFWRLIDCSFGVLCALPLVLILRSVRNLERLSTPAA
jgi:hypothetical protein